MKPVMSHSDLMEKLPPQEKAYLLLYKRGMESSICALQNLEKAYSSGEIPQVFTADVVSVRDIHDKYAVNTVPTLLEFENGEAKKWVKGCNTPHYYKAMFEEASFLAEAKAQGKEVKRITVYSTPTCSWCNTLKAYLRTHKIRFTDVDVSRNPKAAEELVRRSGHQGVPQTDINGEIIAGFNKPLIDEQLGIQEH